MSTLSKCQIVPAVSGAVHGAIEELVDLVENRKFSCRLFPRTNCQIDARKAFSYFDKNRDGKLSIKEFQSVMRDLGYKSVNKRFVRQMFAEASRNGNGRTLSYVEFVEFLESKSSSQIDVDTLFNCYDLDRNGFIEPKELRKVMKRLTGEKLSKSDIEEMIRVADRNGDGLLDKNEFALLFAA